MARIPNPDADATDLPLPDAQTVEDQTVEDQLVERPAEADEADVIEQHQEVPDDGEDEAPRVETD